MEDDEENIVFKDIKFGSRYFRARAKRFHPDRYVFLLEVPPNPITCWLSSFLPLFVVSQLLRFLPEWFLPTRVILKERHPERASDLENEEATYWHLQSLQSTFIPRLFGKVAVALTPAQTRYRISKRPTPGILLEYIDGKPLHELPADKLSVSLVRTIKCLFDLFTKNGVVLGDPKLDNFILAGTKVFAVDLEHCHFLPSDMTNDHGLETVEDEIRDRLDWLRKMGNEQ